MDTLLSPFTRNCNTRIITTKRGLPHGNPQLSVMKCRNSIVVAGRTLLHPAAPIGGYHTLTQFSRMIHLRMAPFTDHDQRICILHPHSSLCTRKYPCTKIKNPALRYYHSNTVTNNHFLAPSHPRSKQKTSTISHSYIRPSHLLSYKTNHLKQHSKTHTLLQSSVIHINTSSLYSTSLRFLSSSPSPSPSPSSSQASSLPFKNTHCRSIHTSIPHSFGFEEFFLGSTTGGVGRAWSIHECRLKSAEDLQKLWWLCIKERNMLLTYKHTCTLYDLPMQHPERFEKIQKTMTAIKHTLGERALQYRIVTDPGYTEKRNNRLKENLKRSIRKEKIKLNEIKQKRDKSMYYNIKEKNPKRKKVAFFRMKPTGMDDVNENVDDDGTENAKVNVDDSATATGTSTGASRNTAI